MLLAVHALSLAALAPPPQRVSSGLDRRALLGAALAAAVLPPAPSFADEVEMSEITSRNIDCPKKFFLPAKGSWQCIEVTAKANNIGKKDLGAIFGPPQDFTRPLVQIQDNSRIVHTSLENDRKMDSR